MGHRQVPTPYILFSDFILPPTLMTAHERIPRNPKLRPDSETQPLLPSD